MMAIFGNDDNDVECWVIMSSMEMSKPTVAVNQQDDIIIPNYDSHSA